MIAAGETWHQVSWSRNRHDPRSIAITRAFSDTTGTPIALQFTRQSKTRLAFAAAMTFVLSVVSVAMIPLALEVMPEAAKRTQRPVMMLVANIALYIALPLVCADPSPQSMPNAHGPSLLPSVKLAFSVTGLPTLTV